MLNTLIFNPIVVKLLRKFYFNYVKWEEAYISQMLAPEKTVLNGPFKGMKYPGYHSSGSGLITKFVGSYEDELHPFIQSLNGKQYDSIIDIGCAEGYYAVGLGKLFSKAKIYAYDIDAVALERCRKMAELNGIQERTVFRALCDRKELLTLPKGNRSFILCDCEGYENELFDEEVAAALVNCDLIIELHEHAVKGTKQNILNAFSKTHDVELVGSKLKSVDDYPLMKQLPATYQQDRFLIDRDRHMEWACITAR